MPPLKHALLGRDATPAIGLEDRGDVHRADEDTEVGAIALKGEWPAQVQVDSAAGLVPGAVGDAGPVAAKARSSQGVGKARQDILPRAGDDLLAHLGEAGCGKLVQARVGCLHAGQPYQRLGRTIRAAGRWRGSRRWPGLCGRASIGRTRTGRDQQHQDDRQQERHGP